MSTIIFRSYEKTVQDILNYYERGQLDLEPGFQRASVWGERDRAKLIDSILQNYPLPSIFLYANPEDDGEMCYYVLDGKQRIESILMFMGYWRGYRFAVKSLLDGQEKEEKLMWADIKRRKLQHKITNYKLQVIEVTGEWNEIINLFIRINSTGKALTKAEIRHADYYQSDFLISAEKLSRRFENYFIENGIISRAQISRMKHTELICELMVAAHCEDVTNKKVTLDKMIKSAALSGRELEKAVKQTETCLKRIKTSFPYLKQTRFKQITDFYSLAVLMQKLERERLVLADRKRNKLAMDLLAVFGAGVDTVSHKHKSMENLPPNMELYRQYLVTVREGTDQIDKRRARERILRNLLEPIYQTKHQARFYSPEQRRILWNTTEIKKCVTCRKTLSWDDFTIDHIDPWSKGGRTELDNAALMCRKHNSQKGNG